MNIKDIRGQTGLSQSKFSKLVGIPIGTIQKWEIGYQRPPRYVITLIEENLTLKGILNAAK